MTDALTLEAGQARAVVMPGLGGGLAGLRVADRPVLRPWSGVQADGPFALACNLLAPFSNRISGGFDWQGQRIALTPTLEGEAFPIHGDAFQRSWTVDRAEAARATLRLDGGHIGPWVYAATVDYRLRPDGLTIAMDLVSRAQGPLPFGLGFHPWFPRNSGTRLAFSAQGVWHEDARHLPAAMAPAAVPEAWDFTTARPLPDGWINNAFDGWNHELRITQGEDAVPVTMRAAGGLDTLIVYSPDASADFFCAEPVSHPVDAHNLPGRPGLVTLAPGDSLRGEVTLCWDA